MERGRHTWLPLIGILLFVATCASGPSSRHASTSPDIQGPSIIPLSVHYLTDEKDIRHKFEQSLEQSNQTLMPHGVGLIVWSEDRLYRLPEQVATRHDRQRLGGRVVEDGTVHIFIVDKVSLEPGDGLNGLHAHSGRHDFVILSKTARKTTLAHEIGHALGLSHETDKDNVMCTQREDVGARFTSDQGDSMRSAARELVKRDW